MEITEVKSKRDLSEFINLPYYLSKRDRYFVPPLKKEVREKLSLKNPFFRHADVRYFIAVDKGKTCGRIASVINRRHLEFHKDGAGFFGFFDSVNDPGVAGALLESVEKELKENSMSVMRGPMSFSTNDECGFLTEGFDEHPMLMTPYNPPYYNDLMEIYGMHKAKDLLAFIYEIKDRLPEKVLRVAVIGEKRGLTVRPVDKKRFEEEMQVFKEVYNSAWEKNWGFIPLTDEELNYLGNNLKQIARPELTLIAEDDGRPVGFMGLLPDFNYVLRHMQGRLNPFTVSKAIYYSKKIEDLRLLLLGIKKEYRNRGVDALLFREGFAGIKKGGYKRVEFSWILEDNIPVQRLVEMIGGRLYKKYRIYEKEI